MPAAPSAPIRPPATRPAPIVMPPLNTSAFRPAKAPVTTPPISAARPSPKRLRSCAAGLGPENSGSAALPAYPSSAANRSSQRRHSASSAVASAARAPSASARRARKPSSATAWCVAAMRARLSASTCVPASSRARCCATQAWRKRGRRGSPGSAASSALKSRPSASQPSARAWRCVLRRGGSASGRSTSVSCGRSSAASQAGSVAPDVPGRVSSSTASVSSRKRARGDFFAAPAGHSACHQGVVTAGTTAPSTPAGTGCSCRVSPSSLRKSVCTVRLPLSISVSKSLTADPSPVTSTNGTHSSRTVGGKPGRISGCRASKYGVSSGSGKRCVSRAARTPARQASRLRGSTTASSKVAASRWIQGAAVTVASAPGPTRSGATSGTAMPVTKLAGASNQRSAVCTWSTVAKVLCQPAR